MSEDWCTIESDPGVFTVLCEEIGVKGIQFEEIYSLDPEAFSMMDANQIYGLIFLFKWRSEADNRATVEAPDHGIWFANQVIQNACATQAILSVLLNAENLDIGPHLKDFKEFTATLDSQMKGLAIENSEVIRKAHNSFRHQSSFEIVQDKDAKGEDAFHFIGYLCHENKVYELDGLKKGPILIGEVEPGKSWPVKATEEIQRRIATYTEKAAAAGGAEAEGAVELRFNLMAITVNKQMEAEKLIAREQYLRQRAIINLVSRGEDVDLIDDLNDDEAPADIPSFEDLSTREVAALQELVKTCTATISEHQQTVAAEKLRRARWAKENARRRFDLVPLALCAMRHLARKKQLLPAFEKGKALVMKKAEEKKAAQAVAAN